jgi:hypothetical protein
MNLHQAISLQTKIASESIGYDNFQMVQTVIPTGELRKTCTLWTLYRWIKDNYHMEIETNYPTDETGWCYLLKWCEGYGVETFLGEFLYIDNDSKFDTEELAFDAGLQRAIEEIKHIIYADEYKRSEKKL